ncbi:hypothetical protein EV356DRAFT_516661 [Viridothelium virens]|uniref:Uncharacterized protein n=1 Tax=Viridothelium virens TaxID=1048519 RepID=A0A6A6HLA8_VIRVR|nr:hypothetical protein EV356DRAFT_516661 [Viridothelium virens]
MSSTSAPHLGDDTGPIVVSSSSEWPTSISELVKGVPMTESERTSNFAASEMRMWWREGTGNTAYRKVAVLLVKWAEDLDQLNCSDEVRSLDELFRKSFRYHTKIVQLHNEYNVNLQLHSAFVEFLKEHDGPNNLIIVYYTGHGSQNVRTGQLVLLPTNRVVDARRSKQSPNAALAAWEEVEIHLMHNAKCDALSILDCCFAGDVHKSVFQEDDRTYQLLSAAGKGKMTRAPGPESFTRALIKSLSQLQQEHGEKPFTTLQLQARIQSQPERQNNPPFLWHRLHRYENLIFLAPLTEQSAQTLSNVGKPSRAFLTLRVALEEETLDKDQVVTLGSKLTKAAKSSGAHVRRVDLVNFSVSSRKRSLLQVVRNIALPFVRFKRGLKRDLNLFQSDSYTVQLPTTRTSHSVSPPDKVSSPHRISEGSAEQAHSGHAPQLSPRELGKRNRSPIPRQANKRRRHST